MSKERPILFSAPMVCALLAGTKTQTRRICKAEKAHDDGEDYRDTDGWPLFDASVDGAGDVRIASPYGSPGDKLWVREAWAAPHAFDHLPPRLIPPGTRFHYAASEDCGGLRGRPSIHMPRWASRINLEVTGVRVERIQDISRGDAMAEGCPFPNMAAGDNPRDWYADLWRQINGADSWDANPWVWCISFRRL